MSKPKSTTPKRAKIEELALFLEHTLDHLSEPSPLGYIPIVVNKAFVYARKLNLWPDAYFPDGIFDADQARERLVELRGRVRAKIEQMSGAKKHKRKRRRRASKRDPKLTAKQVEAMQLVGEHKGNIAAAARAAGKSRTAMSNLYKKATTKVGKKAVRLFTKQIPKDDRGQETIAEED